ncbi:MAG: cupin domain-containing protein [Brevibacterium linens]
MSAMEPINTHDFPLSHEPVEEWQNVSAASAGEADTVESLESEGSAASAKESVTTGFAELGTIGGADFGLWEMSAGSMRDIEGHEVFLVISGTGRIEFDEPRRDPIELAPGSLVHLDEGMKTRWYIDGAPLRKLFIAPSEG